jgi:hypothetical protein
VVDLQVNKACNNVLQAVLQVELPTNFITQLQVNVDPRVLRSSAKANWNDLVL